MVLVQYDRHPDKRGPLDSEMDTHRGEACEGTQGEGQGEAEAEEGGGCQAPKPEEGLEHSTQPSGSTNLPTPGPRLLASRAVRPHTSAILGPQAHGASFWQLWDTNAGAWLWLLLSCWRIRPWRGLDRPLSQQSQPTSWWEGFGGSPRYHQHCPRKSPALGPRERGGDSILIPFPAHCAAMPEGPASRPRRPESRCPVTNYRADCTPWREIPDRHLLTPNPAHHRAILIFFKTGNSYE